MRSPVSNHRSAAAPATDNQSDSDHQSLADDEEYEEIEVEEETEVEEDETDGNGDDEDDDFGEDLSPVNRDQTRDASPDNVSLEHEDQPHSVLLTQENAVKVISKDMHEVEGDKGAHISVQMDVSEGRDSNSLHSNLPCSDLGKDVIATGDHKYKEPKPHSLTRTPKDHVEQKNTELPNSNGILTVQTSESARSVGTELTAAVSMKDDLGGKATGLYFSEEEKKHQRLQNEDVKLNEPRLEFPTLKPSSVSPGVEFKAGTEKPAIICDFFAQGWCIKGKSCRFLHVSNITTQQHSGAEADASHKTERRTSGGSDCSSKKPRFTSPDEVAPAVGSSYSSDKLLSHELGQSFKWKNESEEVSPYKDNSSSAGREFPSGENWYLNNHGKHNVEEMAAMRSQFSLDARMPPFCRSWEANFNSGKLPPTHVSSMTRSSLPSGSTWNSDPLKSHKCLDVEREYGASRSASLQKTPSPFSGSESNNASRMLVSGESQYPAGYKTEVSSYRWELSAPFRPSSDLAKRLLSSVHQYDPIRDSIEQSNSADVYSRFSGAVQESFVSGYNFGERSLGGNHNILDSNLNKTNYGKDLFSAETGTPLSAITEMQNKVAAPKEEKLLESSYIQHIEKRNTPNTVNDDYAIQTDSSRQKLKSGDIAGQISEIEVDVKVSEDMTKEMKALKQFRAALIDFVKELVKPTWRQGNLSKDVHKMIVKRAVDKVLSTVPTHQIPFTSEAVELYLSSSESKISKLVEGYIDKYGKL